MGVLLLKESWLLVLQLRSVVLFNILYFREQYYE